MQVGGDVAAFGLPDARGALLLERAPQPESDGDREQSHADECRQNREEGGPEGGELDLAEDHDGEADDDEGRSRRDAGPVEDGRGETFPAVAAARRARPPVPAPERGR